MPELSQEEFTEYQESGVEINSAEDEPELQEFFIDGSEK